MTRRTVEIDDTDFVALTPINMRVGLPGTVGQLIYANAIVEAPFYSFAFVQSLEPDIAVGNENVAQSDEARKLTKSQPPSPTWTRIVDRLPKSR
ncbi:hypothetical protein [Nitrobacter sp.]|uniref:hypothetical protein n=1 Tax=Nitrobacter sp. TaxID=29420 RepID=UPI003F64FFF1